MPFGWVIDQKCCLNTFLFKLPQTNKGGETHHPTRAGGIYTQFLRILDYDFKV